MKLTITNHKEKVWADRRLLLWKLHSFPGILNGSVISKQAYIALQAIYNIIYVNQK